MNKRFLILGLVCAVGLMTACSKQEGTTSASQESTKPVIPQKTFVQQSGVSLYPGGTPLYRENAEGKMVYADEVAKGEVLSVYYDASTNQIEAREAIRLLSSGKEDTMNFTSGSTYPQQKRRCPFVPEGWQHHGQASPSHRRR